MSDFCHEHRARIGVIGLKGFPAYGGSARAGENLVELLKHKFDFTIYNVSTHTNRTSGYYNGYKQIVFKKFPIRRFNTFIYYVRALIHSMFFADYDIIHIYHIDAAFIIPILKIKYKVIAGVRARPQLLSKWSWPEKQYFRCMEYLFLKWPADILTSNSHAIINEYKTRTIKKIHYIPNGIWFTHVDRDLPEIAYNDYLLFASGRIIESKGCHVFLEAVKKIGYSGKVLVIGDLTHSPKYSAYLKEITENMDVTFTGLIKEKTVLMSYIKEAKIAVYPSFVEAMSNMLLEMGAMKTPVICSDISENTVVFDETEALHFKNKDADDLAIKLEWALNNMETMRTQAEKAYNKLKSDYNWENLALKYNELFMSLLLDSLHH